MTAAEIRKLPINLDTENFQIVCLLREIAAQLAELNGRLESMMTPAERHLSISGGG